MPNMANITVKNVAGTDVIFVAAAPSAGDRIPAVWTQDALSGIQAFRPRFQVTTRNNGGGSVRRMEYVLEYPVTYTDSTTGLEKLLSTIKMEGAVHLPVGVTTDQWLEAFTQGGNLLVSALIRSVASSGYAPT